MFQCYRYIPNFIFLFFLLFLEACSLDPSLFDSNVIEQKTVLLEAKPEITIKTIVVQKGDTLFSISKKYFITVEEIMRLNKLKQDSTIYVGQALVIPKNNKNALYFSLDSKDENIKIVSLPLPKPKKHILNLSLNGISFIQPIKGEIINKFGSNDDGVINEGINIEAEYGTKVKASADGEIIFAGSNLKDFGSMILIKHNDHWISSYAHLSKIYVNERDHISQGQLIGEVGTSGKVFKAQLYFEIRNKNEALNPEDFVKG